MPQMRYTITFMSSHEHSAHYSFQDVKTRSAHGNELDSLVAKRLEKMQLFEAGQITYLSELQEDSATIVDWAARLTESELRIELWEGRALVEARSAAGLPFHLFNANSPRKTKDLKTSDQRQAFYDNYQRVIDTLETQYQSRLEPSKT